MEPWAVPLSDVDVSDELAEAVRETVKSGWWSMGPRVAELEREFASFCGTAHALAVEDRVPVSVTSMRTRSPSERAASVKTLLRVSCGCSTALAQASHAASTTSCACSSALSVAATPAGK